MWRKTPPPTCAQLPFPLVSIGLFACHVRRTLSRETDSLVTTSRRTELSSPAGDLWLNDWLGYFGGGSPFQRCPSISHTREKFSGGGGRYLEGTLCYYPFKDGGVDFLYTTSPSGGTYARGDPREAPHPPPAALVLPLRDNASAPCRKDHIS